MRRIFTLMTILVGLFSALSGSERVRTQSARVAFFDASGCGWIAGDAGVFRSEDWGRSWETRDRGVLPTSGRVAHGKMIASGQDSAWVTDASFQDCWSAWVITGQDRLWKTNNGGIRWQEVTPKGPPHSSGRAEPLIQVMAIDPDTAFVTTPKNLHKTSDGGLTWTKYSLSPWLINPITGSLMQFVDRLHGWYLEDDPPPRFWSTRDGGEAWDKIKPDVLQDSFSEVYVRALRFVSPDLGYLVLEGPGLATPAIFHTSDAGKSWRPFGPGLGGIRPPLRSVGGVSPLPGGGLLMTYGVPPAMRIGGPLPYKNVLAVSNSNATVIYSGQSTAVIPFFISAKQGWLVVVRGQREFEVLGTKDGGTRWTSFATVRR